MVKGCHSWAPKQGMFRYTYCPHEKRKAPPPPALPKGPSSGASSMRVTPASGYGVKLSKAQRRERVRARTQRSKYQRTSPPERKYHELAACSRAVPNTTRNAWCM